MQMCLMYIISCLILKSCCISFDYYINYEDIESNKNIYNNSVKEARRSDNHNELIRKDSFQIERTISGDNRSSANEFDEYNDNFEIYEAKDKADVVDTISDKSLQVSLSNETNNTILNYLQEKINISTSEKVTSLCLFDEYEYDYEDSSIKPHNLLRNYLSNNNEINMTSSNNSFNNQATTPDTVNNTRYMTNFYNLEPAISRVNIKELVASSGAANNTVWYVLEKYPCWDLPSLYAEFGQRNNVEDIFVLNSNNLKNVIHEEIENISDTKPVLMPFANVINKWCTTKPCYGDHTLCLFSDKRISSICDKGYIVAVPTILQRRALVDTINSMRNRVANGLTKRYKHLPAAANMKQIIYDVDLEKMSKVWLSQCLPGPAPCSSLGDSYVSQLECTKFAKYCCVTSDRRDHVQNCIPQPECYVPAIIGCIHKWYWSAGQKLTATDIECGHSASSTYNTVQLLWAETFKVGCAYGKRRNDDRRVVCNFSPGAPIYMDARLYCGLIVHKDITDRFQFKKNLKINLASISPLGIDKTLKLDKVTAGDYTQLLQQLDETKAATSGLDNLNNIYNRGWLRKILGSNTNRTKGVIARLVTKYTFYEQTQERCDIEDPVYITGKPGSLCVQRGKRFDSLCYGFSDPAPGYRLVAIIAPAVLFSLILYNLFSGVIRQTNY